MISVLRTRAALGAVMRTSVLGLLIASLSPHAAHAQSANLVGLVKDDLGRPLPGAVIRVLGRDRSAVSDDEGRFRVPNVPLGLIDIGARRLGYVPVADLIRLTRADTIEFTLDRIAQKGDTIRAQSRADASWERDLQRFGWAVDAARFGVVVTERDILAANAQFTTDLLQGKSGFSVIGSGATARLVSSRGRCTPTVLLDGQAAPGYSINNVSPQSIKLLIAYRDAATIPPEMMTTRVNASCGVVAIVTL